MIPLSEKLRPTDLKDLFGQDHLISSEGILSKSIETKKPYSFIFWGPPGCGKTTLARLYARSFDARFYSLSAVFSGVSEIKKIIREIEQTPLLSKLNFLFVDEIHRFNTAQQDAFLPYLEKGTFVLLGATTENPSFSLNNALLSRMRVLTLNSLTDESLERILSRYENRYEKLSITKESKELLISLSQGDGRYLLNLIENISSVSSEKELSPDEISPYLQKRSSLYDKHKDAHFNLISALHKSVRGSDPDASLYWFCRMLEGGEAPLYIARRLIRMATEDIGLADPNALRHVLSARDAYQMLGSPEGELALAQAVLYLSLAPKSNAAYTAYTKARVLASQTTQLSPPKHILNAPTKFMKDLDYGKGYLYDHETPNRFSGQNYFPDDIEDHTLYEAHEIGYERELKKRQSYFSKLKKSLNSH